jgi:hypothetical protein
VEDLQPLIDKLHDKSDLLSKCDSLVLVKSVLAATCIHAMLVTDMPKPIKGAIVKCQRFFFWATSRNDGGGSSAVACSDVAAMSILAAWRSGLKRMGWALCVRCSWLGRVDPTKPWASFPIKQNRHISALILAATKSRPRDGTKLLFGTDRWLA